MILPIFSDVIGVGTKNGSDIIDVVPGHGEVPPTEAQSAESATVRFAHMSRFQRSLPTREDGSDKDTHRDDMGTGRGTDDARHAHATRAAAPAAAETQMPHPSLSSARPETFDLQKTPRRTGLRPGWRGDRGAIYTRGLGEGQHLYYHSIKKFRRPCEGSPKL